jgi:murein DD-endopeptidase MepM/ murein hydrolase activator NlpD
LTARQHLPAALFILLASACVPVTPVLLPTAIPSPTATSTPLPPATALPAPTAQPILNLIPTVIPTPPISFCSPLSITPWHDLWKIDWNPFTIPMHYDGTKFRDNGHPGVDLVYYSRYGRASISGEGVQSVLDGTIASVIYNRIPYGNMVMTETPYEGIPPELLAVVRIPPGDSLYLVYAHLHDLADLKLGESVHCGQPLGHVGSTGMSTGDHLHFEARWGPPGTEFPSMSYYTADYTDEEVKNYILWRMSGDYIPFDPMMLLTLKQPVATPGSGQGQGPSQ